MVVFRAANRLRRLFPAVSMLALLLVSFFPLPSMAADVSSLEQDLSHTFVGRSFTIRNFYRGSLLKFASDGGLLNKAEPGFWSRDGMVKFSSVKLSSDGLLVFHGERYCVLFDPKEGEFSNVRTGDKLEIAVQIPPDKLTPAGTIPILYKVFVTGKEQLSELVPSYWRNCLSQKVIRIDQSSPWECVSDLKQPVINFHGKTIAWEVEPPDRTLHTGMKRYLIRHRVAYLAEQVTSAPQVLLAPNPFFDWAQNRTVLGDSVLVLGFTVDPDGHAQDVTVVSPVGMGIDDDAVQTLLTWKFQPAKLNGAAVTVPARVIFEILTPDSRLTMPWRDPYVK